VPEKKPLCFVVSPIGGPDSEARAEADWVLKYLIKAALADDYEVKRADEFAQPDVITNVVILSIKNADLVVVDLTDHNPNVFYELALAHMLQKPVIPLIKADQRIPFDNQAMGTIHYSRARVDLWEKAIASLKSAAGETRQEHYKVNNPVTLALGVEQLKLSGDSKEQVIAELREGLQRVSRELDVVKAATRQSTATSAFQLAAERAAIYNASATDQAALYSASAADRALYGTGYASRNPAYRDLFGGGKLDLDSREAQVLLEEAHRVLKAQQKPPK